MNMMILLAPVGVLFLIGLTWVLGGNKTAVLADEQAAIGRFAQDFFTYQADEIVIAENGGHAALLSSQDGVGIVFALGDNFATRLLGSGDVAKLTRQSNIISFKVNEFTGRRIDFACKDADSARHWEQRLQALLG